MKDIKKIFFLIQMIIMVLSVGFQSFAGEKKSGSEQIADIAEMEDSLLEDMNIDSLTRFLRGTDEIRFS